ncbi:MAG: GlsB/YeaQ/YmgE family stress response membrane protein [Gemmatimonadetes bacterium]|nr:GlsB/YeaQ/YmgE family stress response membrane protein [Gemmatimonadota bacterium]MCC7134345.1 GlsB/YeaQ/YmgE family stress response membrane protein [Gemmatimonadales bacterium]
MGLLWTILIGFLVGTIAKVLVPGKDSGGFIITTLLGICGSWVGGWLAGLVGMSPRVGFIGSVVGAVVILVVFRWFKNK